MSDTTEFRAKFQRLLELRVRADETEAAAKKAKGEYKAYEAELYAELTEAGMRGRVGFDFGGELGTAKFQAKKPTIFGQILDKEAAIKALQARGEKEVILTDAVAKGRLNELVRDLLESGEELPEGIGFYDTKGISISRK